MDKNEAGKVTVEYLNTVGCMPVSYARLARLERIEVAAREYLLEGTPKWDALRLSLAE